MDGLLYLEDGTLFKGKGFGHVATNVGELVFNTSMTGYQGILTDPSYKGQIINMTYPLIGNYGVSEIDYQSKKIHAFGFSVRDISFRPSNRHSEMSIAEWLGFQKIPGIYNVDTRLITKKVRTEGTIKCVISTEGISKQEAAEVISKEELRTDYMRDVGTDEVRHFMGTGHRVAVMDFGIKRNILTALTDRGCEVFLFPYSATAEEIMAVNPDGLFLSNGPGDPEQCLNGIQVTKELFTKLPTFGICMGHQVLALAAGGKTYKLKFGHRGANHGVKDLETDKSAITSQNHSFAVEEQSLASADMKVTHVNLNDDTIEGIRHNKLPVFSVQYHPEGSPGPNDSAYLFDRFVEMVGNSKCGGKNA